MPDDCGKLEQEFHDRIRFKYEYLKWLRENYPEAYKLEKIKMREKFQESRIIVGAFA